MYSSPLDHDDPGLGALDRAEGVGIEDAVISILERRNRLLEMRQRAMKAENPALAPARLMTFARSIPASPLAPARGRGTNAGR
jgi:hypothetical protein